MVNAMTECRQIRTTLSARLDGELDPVRQRAVDRHLQACAECRRLLDRMSGVDRWVLEAEPPAGSQDAPTEFLRRLHVRLDDDEPLAIAHGRGDSAAGELAGASAPDVVRPAAIVPRPVVRTPRDSSASGRTATWAWRASLVGQAGIVVAMALSLLLLPERDDDGRSLRRGGRVEDIAGAARRAAVGAATRTGTPPALLPGAVPATPRPGTDVLAALDRDLGALRRQILELDRSLSEFSRAAREVAGTQARELAAARSDPWK
jgi:anti-sigma factor RsiW